MLRRMAVSGRNSPGTSGAAELLRASQASTSLRVRRPAAATAGNVGGVQAVFSQQARYYRRQSTPSAALPALQPWIL